MKLKSIMQKFKNAEENVEQIKVIFHNNLYVFHREKKSMK